jgi:alkanesulfonate monooxygenase SsuD/methylene tetrahydromethanopterin reductase-like flavin-dependent oxidoreductase (luciferase family)
MRYGIIAANVGTYADPGVVVKLAQTAEAARWEALVIWDHLGFVWDGPSGDPWVILAAVAGTTSRLRLGTAVTPLARYRPHVLAHALTTLDILSYGRVVLGVGLGGVPGEFTAFGDPGDAGVRAAMLDESLDVLTALWSGERVAHQRRFYTVDDVRLAPLPVQRPRIPIWVGGNSHAALRRAARWDGWFAASLSEREIGMTPDELADHVETIQRSRTSSAPFEVAMLGYSAPADHDLVLRYERAGATWWFEGIHGLRGSLESMMERVAAGPPEARLEHGA